MSQSPPPATPWVVARGLAGVVQTLLDFEQQPGRYALALREPRALFDHTHAVMLLAAGRAVEGLPPLMPGQHTGAVQQAARYFVRTVLLRPGADHYSLLGLQPDHSPEALRDHYRLMIRLTHPDFAVGGEDEWPADAASRINLANDVLASPVKRREYDAALAASTRAQTASPSGSTAPAHPVKPRTKAPAPTHTSTHTSIRTGSEAEDRSEARERRKRQRKFALAGAGAVVCALVLWLMTPAPNEGSLVAQRPQGNSAPAQPSAIEQAKAELAADQAARTEAEAAAPSAPMAQSAPSAATSTPAKPTATRTTTASPTLTALAPATAQIKPPTPTRQATTVRVSTAAAQADSVATNTDDNRLALALETRLSPTSAGTVSVTPPGNSLNTSPANNTATTEAPPADTGSNTTSPSGLTMAQVQHKLSQVLSGLQSGKAENAVQWLDGHWRDHPAAANFVNNYQRFVGDQRVTQLGKAQFRSRSMAEHFVVDGVVEVSLQADRPGTSPSSPVQTKELNMSAYFMAKDGRPVLTQLVLNRPR